MKIKKVFFITLLFAIVILVANSGRFIESPEIYEIENHDSYVEDAHSSLNLRKVLNVNASLLRSSQTGSNYNLMWSRFYGGSNVQGGMGLCIDFFNNIYQTGYDNDGPNGSRDGVVIKTNQLGIQLWNRTFGKNGSDIGMDVCIDSNDNVYVIGTIDGFPSDSQDKIILLKYDSLGNTYWNRTWSDLSGAHGQSIAIDAKDNIIVAGYGGDIESTDLVIIKYNKTGSKIWQQYWGGSRHEGRFGLKVSVDSQDQIYIAAQTSSFGAGISDAVLIKYDQDGDLLWYKIWGGGGIDGAEAISIDSNDNVFISGYTDSFSTDGRRNLFLTKYNDSGHQYWNKTWEGIGNVKDMTVDSEDNLLITGYVHESNIEFVNLIIIDKSGDVIWNTRWGEEASSMWNTGFGIGVDEFDNIFVSGYTNQYGGYTDDIVLLKYLKLSNEPGNISHINIITPENKTYTGAMNGYFPSTHGFEDTMNGVLPKDWYFFPHHGYGEAYVVEGVDGHRKVLKIEDTYEAAYPEAFQEFTPKESGIVELYLRKETGASGLYFQLYDINHTRAFALKMDQHNNEKFEYGLGSDFIEFARGQYSDQTWFHFRVIFNTLSDKVTIYLDGVLVLDNVDFAMPVESISKIKLGGNYDYTGIFYADAIGYSWQEGYNIGDNSHEGLLLSYTNSTNLDIIGYSLDGKAIITINGNKVIPLPENGVHSITVSGFTSNGTFLKSNLRYFTISFIEPPIPLNLPIFLPVFLTSILIGLVSLIGIAFIVFRIRKPRHSSSIVVYREKPQLEQSVYSASVQVKFCPFCGSQIRITYRFCIKCGASMKNI